MQISWAIILVILYISMIHFRKSRKVWWLSLARLNMYNPQPESMWGGGGGDLRGARRVCAGGTLWGGGKKDT